MEALLYVPLSVLGPYFPANKIIVILSKTQIIRYFILLHDWCRDGVQHNAVQNV